MNKYLAIPILFLSFSTFAKTYTEDPLCIAQGREISIANSPFSFNSIKMSKYAATFVKPNGKSLAIYCGRGPIKVESDGSMVSKNKNVEQKQNEDWIAVQEITEISPMKLSFLLVPAIMLKPLGINVFGTKPMVITSKNENPVRTKITADHIKNSFVVEDPTDSTQKLNFSCDRDGIALNITKDGSSTLKSEIRPGPIQPTPPEIKYTCNTKIDYDYKTGTSVAKQESFVEKVYSKRDYDKMLPPMPPQTASAKITPPPPPPPILNEGGAESGIEGNKNHGGTR
jgi:hypothetical protein